MCLFVVFILFALVGQVGHGSADGGGDGGGDPQKGGNEEWFYLCQAFWNYDDSYGELTDRIRPWFSPLKGYGPFTPFFAALALVRNQSALTPALIAYFEDFVLRTMPINMEEGDFIAVNDNTPSMIAAGLILAGEYFGKPEWIAKGKDRIRTQISAGHSKEDIDHAVRAFGEVKKEMGL